jgi:peptide/nickel transport system substrate-binding protein
VAAQLRDIGIELRLENIEWAQWLEQVFRGKDFDLTIVSHTEPMDIGIYARPEYYFHYDNPAFRAVIERLEAATDPETRTALMREAQEMIAKDAVNGYLFQLGAISVWRAGIEGLWVDRPTQANDLTEVRWAE